MLPTALKAGPPSGSRIFHRIVSRFQDNFWGTGATDNLNTGRRQVDSSGLRRGLLCAPFIGDPPRLEFCCGISVDSPGFRVAPQTLELFRLRSASIRKEQTEGSQGMMVFESLRLSGVPPFGGRVRPAHADPGRSRQGGRTKDSRRNYPGSGFYLKASVKTLAKIG